MLKGTFTNSIRSKKEGNRPLFIYELTGSKTEIDAYVASQGSNIRVSKVGEKPLFFSIAYKGSTLQLEMIEDAGGNPRFFPTNNVKELAIEAKLLDRNTSGGIKAHLEKLAAADFLNSIGAKSSATTSSNEEELIPSEGEKSFGPLDGE